MTSLFFFFFTLSLFFSLNLRYSEFAEWNLLQQESLARHERQSRAGVSAEVFAFDAPSCRLPSHTLSIRKLIVMLTASCLGFPGFSNSAELRHHPRTSCSKVPL